MGGFPSMLDNALRELIKHRPMPSKDYFKSGSLKKNSLMDPISTEDASQAADLARLVESEIIPRLMLAHNAGPGALANLDQPVSLGDESTDSFARMVLSRDSDSLIAYVGTLLQSGLTMESIYVDLMMPAARRLGDYWDEDSISFADVTIGLGRLQQVVRTLGWKPTQEGGPDHSTQSALFVPATTEQHTFGLFIIEDFFRRAGWRTWIETSGLREDVVDMVSHHWFDLLGLSASCDARTEDVAATITAARKASRNPGLLILVGGRLFVERPDLVSLVGADATAATGGDALLIADSALKRLASNA